MKINVDDYLAHYGMPRRSGRYPWGSGENPYQSRQSFLGAIDELRKQGLNDTEIAKGLGMTTTEFRALRSIARNEKKHADIAQAERLQARGFSNVGIGKRMGIPESSVRSLLAPGAKDRADVLVATSNMLKDQVAKKGFIDVGVGVERHIGISQTKLSTAVAQLLQQGYQLIPLKIRQIFTGKQTEMKVLAPPGTTRKEVWAKRHEIELPFEYSQDGGRSWLGMKKPVSVDSKKVQVRYAEEGGSKEDGVIYLRPEVPELSMGGRNYGQVRIAVDDTHYLKGMAIYKHDLPAGVDVVYNTNKSSTGNKHDAMKPMEVNRMTGEIDWDNPFGAMVRQKIDPKSGDVTSAINFVGVKEGAGEEGSWETWSRTLSSQFLSKQNPDLARSQLNMAYDRKKRELDEINSLTNAAVKKRLLKSFADDADSSAVHLKAAALPRQANHVILPVNSLKDNEVYAPWNYKNGERVVLIRHPHGGKFEIPELVVNNRNREARNLLGNARDAIGINHNVAQRLSGADFDGDTVLVIPNPQGRIKAAPALERLKGFDPVSAYPGYEGMPVMTPRNKGVEMGKVSNLITDMTLQGAPMNEIARAVRHSMVVIDAEKHGLNYKQSEIDNGISQLQKKYQGRVGGGAATLISRARSREYVPERNPRPMKRGGPIDPETGRLVFEPTGATRTTFTKKGTPKTELKTERSTKLAEADDAHTLVSSPSGTRIERIYADHSNRLKSLANAARKEMVSLKNPPSSPSAKAAYSNEVASLVAKLDLAIRNAPLERRAQILANTQIAERKRANPDMEESELKKIKTQVLREARARTGANKSQIDITESEWAAIQAGAISASRLTQILQHADLDRVKQMATPKSSLIMTPAKLARAQSMLASGYTQAEVADQLGVSVATLNASLED